MPGRRIPVTGPSDQALFFPVSRKRVSGLAMDTYQEQRRCIWVTGCVASKRNVEISHLYGEFACDWKSVLFLSAAELKRKGEAASLLLLMMLEGYEDIYYLEINKINTRQFFFGESSQADTRFSALLDGAQNEDYRKVLAFVVDKIRPYLTRTCIDSALDEFLPDISRRLPEFHTFFEVADYCVKTYDVMAAAQTLGESKKDDDDDDLKYVAKPQVDRREWEEGTVIDNHFLVQKVHKGGMGVVYEVFDINEVRFIAWKTFQDRFMWDNKVKNLFINEAEIWVKLDRHPHIVNAELVRVIEGRPFICIEFVHGTDLEELIAEESLTIRSSIEYAIQFCSGMDYAFKKLGLIHRDIKPSNCLITREGVLKITDFGLGRIFDEISEEEAQDLIDELPPEELPKTSEPINPSITVTSIEGTLPYMAPELFSDKKVSHKTDIYAFGLLLYTMLAGRNPMHSNNPDEIMKKQMDMVPDNPHALNSDIPVALGDLVMKCIDKDHRNRFDSFAEIGECLEEIYEATYGTRYVMPVAIDDFTGTDWCNKGLSLASLGRHNEALLAFDQAMKQDEPRADVRLHRCISLVALGRCVEALGELQELEDQMPDSYLIWFWRGEACRISRDFPEALSCFDRAATLAPDNSDILIHKAQVYIDTGQDQEALSLLERAVEINPRSERAWFEKGTLLLKMDLNDAASESFRHAIDSHPDFADAWTSRGEALYRLGFFKEAVDSYKKTLTIDDKNVRARVGIGNAYREIGNHDRAILSFDSVIAIAPDDSAAYIAKAQLLMRKGKWEAALECVKSALENCVENQEIEILKARCLLELGFYDDALELLKAIPQAGEEVKLLLGSALVWRKEKETLVQRILLHRKFKPEGVFDAIETALENFCDPLDAARMLACHLEGSGDVRLWNMLATLYMIAGRTADAEKSVCRALELDKACSEALNLRERIRYHRELNERQSTNAADSCFRRLVFEKQLEALPRPRGAHSTISGSIRNIPLDIAVAVEQRCLEKECSAVPALTQPSSSPEKSGGKSEAKLDAKPDGKPAGKSGGKPEGKGIAQKKGEKRGISYLDLLAMAMREHERKYHLKAIWLLEKVAALNPELQVTRFYEAKNYEFLGDHKRAKEYYEKFSCVYADSPGFCKHRILTGLRSGADLGEMSLLFEKWIGLYPDNMEAWVFYARHLEETGQSDRARLVVLIILDRFSREDFKRYEEGLTTLGILYLQVGRVAAARALFQEVLKSDEHNEAALMAMGKCIEADGTAHQARAYYEKMAQDKRAPVTCGYQIASLFLSQDSAINAMKPIEAACAQKLHSLLLSFKKGQVLVSRRKLIEFFLLTTEVKDLGFEYFPLRQLKSIALVHTGKIDDAISELEGARILAPGDPRFSRWLAALYLKKNQYEQALQVCDELFSHDPFDTATLLLNAITHYYMEKFEEAFSFFRRSLLLNPNSYEITLFLAVLKLYSSRKEDDISLFRKAQKLTSDCAPVWVNLGIFYMKQKKHSQALQYFEGVLRVNPDNSLAWLLRGICKQSLGAFAEARKSAEKAANLSPDDTDAWVLKGTIEYKEGNYREGAESFGRAARIDDKNWKYHYNLGFLHLLAGNFKAASEAFEIATELNNDHFESHIGRYLSAKMNEDADEFLEGLESMNEMLNAAKAVSPKKFEEWTSRSLAGDLKSQGLDLIEVQDVPYALSFGMLEKVFEPFTLYHFLECDRAFDDT